MWNSKIVGVAMGVSLCGAAAACAAIGAGGASVMVASETALIVWDAQTHTEQFVRVANFRTAAPNLGFLVPTPTPPTLSTVAPHALDLMESVAERHYPEPIGFGCAAASFPAAAMETHVVYVLNTETVSGYDASVLASANPSAVVEWLKTNGYPASEATAAWLAPYLKKKWTITAFKVHGESGAAHLAPVRMAFHADEPFYPYREPKGADSGGGRSLRVFFVGNEPVEGRTDGGAWPAKVEMSDELSQTDLADLTAKIPQVDFRGATYLTTFFDPSSPRPGVDDIVFSKEGPRFPTVPVGVVAILGGLVYYRRRRARASTVAAPAA